MSRIETERTYLRSFKFSDFESLMQMLEDNEVMRFTGFKEAQTRERAKQLLSQWSDDKGIWGAFHRETHNFIGWFMLKKTVSNNYPEIGFMLEKRAWNQGYATEIANQLLAYAKAKLGVERVIASCDANNVASIKVLKKLGMSPSNNFSAKGNIVYYETKP